MKKGKIVLLICAVVAVSLCTITAFAADGNPFGLKSGSLFKVQNGKASYSADGGETWTEELPPDVEFYAEVFDDGRVISWVGDERPSAPPDFSGRSGFSKRGEFKDGVTVKSEDGVMMYSEDGGETWSTTPPDGVEISPDGKVTGKGRAHHFSGNRAQSEPPFLVKHEDDRVLFSEDGGETWSENAPEGFAQSGEMNRKGGKHFWRGDFSGGSDSADANNTTVNTKGIMSV